jgi:hypothetical protein
VSDLTFQLGARQTQIMHHLWANGPSTVRELWGAISRESWLSYTTLLTHCRRLLERGLLERWQVTAEDSASRSKLSYVYATRVSEAAVLCHPHDRQPIFMRSEPVQEPAFVGIVHHLQNGSERATIERVLAYLGSLRAPDGQPVDDEALDTITALLERAESAERAILMYQAEALRALQRAEIAEGKKRPKSAAVIEYTGQNCRVCGKPAPPPCGQRLDTLRVCSAETCRREARRRDGVIKQRRAKARKQVSAP